MLKSRRNLRVNLLKKVYLVTARKRVANVCTSVRNVRQLIKVKVLYINISAVNMKVFSILVNTVGMLQHKRVLLKGMKNLFITVSNILVTNVITKPLNSII